MKYQESHLKNQRAEKPAANAQARTQRSEGNGVQPLCGRQPQVSGVLGPGLGGRGGSQCPGGGVLESLL